MFQGTGGCISGSECIYMVVFQYGSIVLFNVREHEVDEYLKVVERHASGLLPEMRKDGELHFFFYRMVISFISLVFVKLQNMK